MLLLRRSRQVQRVLPRTAHPTDRRAAWLPHLPDGVAAVGVAVRACEQAPIQRFAGVVVVQIPVVQIEAGGVIFVARLGVHTWLGRRALVVAGDEAPVFPIPTVSALVHVEIEPWGVVEYGGRSTPARWMEADEMVAAVAIV